MIGFANATPSLESSCSDHAELMIKRGAVRDSAELSGHAMMLSCPPHSVIVDSMGNAKMPYPHDAHAIAPQDFDMMLATANQVNMNGEVNPFGALNMIRSDDRFPSFTKDEFNMIKMDLQLKSRCYGYAITTFHPIDTTFLSSIIFPINLLIIIPRFGAMLEEFEVNDAMDYTVAARYGPEAVEALRQSKLQQSKYPGQVQQNYSTGHISAATNQQNSQQQQQYINGPMYSSGFN